MAYAWMPRESGHKMCEDCGGETGGFVPGAAVRERQVCGSNLNGKGLAMTHDQDSFLAQYRAIVERRVREQIARHENVDAGADPRRAVEIQIQQEREKLERLIEKDEITPDQAELFRLLIEWLPELERKIKGR